MFLVRVEPRLARNRLILENVRNLRRRDHPAVDRAHDEIVRVSVTEWLETISFRPLVELAELLPQLTNGPRHQLPEITECELGVLAR